ncbi:MAG: carbohydrate porin [Acidiferrobacteraceae bacterium]
MTATRAFDKQRTTLPCSQVLLRVLALAATLFWVPARCYAHNASTDSYLPIPRKRETTADRNRGARRLPRQKTKKSHDDLHSQGIDLSGSLLTDISRNLRGGLNDQSVIGQYLVDLRAKIKTARLFGWNGGTLFVDFQGHRGRSVQARQTGSIQDPDNMDAYNVTGIDRAWYQQDLAEKRVRLRIGLMYVDDQFLRVPYARDFVSLDFSSDASISTFVLPTYPRGAFGVDTFVFPVRSFYVAAGLFDGHLYHVLPYDPGGDLFIAQTGLKGRVMGLPGVLELGMWRHTGTFQRFTGGQQHHASGEYLVAGFRVYRPHHTGPETARGVGVFFQYGAGPPTVALISQHVGAGIVWTGPSRDRPRDSLGLGVSDARLSAQAGFLSRFETIYETYYRFSVSRTLSIQPDLQYWHHPGGNGTPSALLFLVRTAFRF